MVSDWSSNKVQSEPVAQKRWEDKGFKPLASSRSLKGIVQESKFQIVKARPSTFFGIAKPCVWQFECHVFSGRCPFFLKNRRIKLFRSSLRMFVGLSSSDIIECLELQESGC